MTLQPVTTKSQDKLKFVLLITGQIETAEFFSSDDFYFKYSYAFGNCWTQVAGLEEGLSSRCQRKQSNTMVVVALPLEATFASTNPFGWPQLVLSCYGTDSFGNDIIKGYGAAHIPTIPGKSSFQIPTFVPEASSTLQKFIGWMTGKRPEFIDTRTVASAQGRSVTRVRSQGTVNITMHVMLKDLKKLGYDCLPTTISQISEFPIPLLANGETKLPKSDQTCEETEQATCHHPVAHHPAITISNTSKHSAEKPDYSGEQYLERQNVD